MSDPIPPTPVKASLLTAGKIFLVVTVFLAMQEGTQAFAHTFDWSNFMSPAELLKTATAVGFGCLYGAMQGAMRAIQVVLAVWSGPTLWGYLGPILAGAAAIAANAASSLAKIFRRDKTPANK